MNQIFIYDEYIYFYFKVLYQSTITNSYFIIRFHIIKIIMMLYLIIYIIFFHAG